MWLKKNLGFESVLAIKTNHSSLPMRRAKFFSDGVGATAACALRLIEGLDYCGQMCVEEHKLVNDFQLLIL